MSTVFQHTLFSMTVSLWTTYRVWRMFNIVQSVNFKLFAKLYERVLHLKWLLAFSLLLPSIALQYGPPAALHFRGGGTPVYIGPDRVCTSGGIADIERLLTDCYGGLCSTMCLDRWLQTCPEPNARAYRIGVGAQLVAMARLRLMPQKAGLASAELLVVSMDNSWTGGVAVMGLRLPVVAHPLLVFALGVCATWVFDLLLWWFARAFFLRQYGIPYNVKDLGDYVYARLYFDKDTRTHRAVSGVLRAVVVIAGAFLACFVCAVALD